MTNEIIRRDVDNSSSEVTHNSDTKNLMFLNYQNIDKNNIPNNSVPWRLPPDGVKDIVRGTTPEHFIYLPFNNNDITSLLITYKQGFYIVEKRLPDVRWYVDKKTNQNIAYFQFTQEETNLFEPVLNKPCRVQVRVLLKNHDVIASEIYNIKILDVLNEEEL